jgi:hypothetical protein
MNLSVLVLLVSFGLNIALVIAWLRKTDERDRLKKTRLRKDNSLEH